tara:strand:- start:326 stop:2401 length:2076 start_codon:yes stop_codon:yes gene_type:complete
MFDFPAPVSELKGVGSQRNKILIEHSISNIGDLLYYFPRRYLDRSTITPIKKFKKGDLVTLIGSVETFGVKSTRRGKIFQVIVTDNTGILTLTWFNGIQYLKNFFKLGDKIAIYGKVDYYNGFTITHPEFDKLNKDDDPISTGKIIPLYPLTKELKSVGLDQRVFRNMVNEVLTSGFLVDEILPKNILAKLNLISIQKALHWIHYSRNIGDLKKAIKRLKFDEHLFLQLLMALRKKTLQRVGAKPLLDTGPYFKLLLDSLDFELTHAQKRVINEIQIDLKKDIPMNRLLQGDVGSGKTIVSILVASIAIASGVQVAFMAPTEILASQQFNSFKQQLDKIKIPCAQLMGKMSKKMRTPILDGIKSGDIPIIIGTHALIQKDVKFNNLGLVIVDEQHRFGVDQRASLIEKGFNPHFLAMTATPIPRTLSITYHGDMDISILDEKPSNRIPIRTKVVEPSRLEKVYEFIKKEVNSGYQCMIIYPLVEESEKSDLVAAKQAFKNLDSNIFPDIKVGLVHGKMKSDQKDEVMQKFSNNKISILVSTTVVEVGVDVPNATIMLIEHAERFGLSQLHQLRGRVGRGIDKSYCILVQHSVNEASRMRLNIMEETDDGFIIADEDLKIRGPGQFFGMKQSGFFKYKIANMVTDGSIIDVARELAIAIIEKDPHLKSIENYELRKIFIKNYSNQLDQLKLS